MTRRRVYLMRHADVRYADEGGRPLEPDGVPLTGEGRRQARGAGAALAGVPLDRAITSGLPRAVETAELVLGGGGPAREARAALREIRSSRVASLPHFEDAFLYALSRPQTAEDRFLGGETWGSLQQRALPCFRELLQERDWRHLLLVAHGGVNRVILLEALGGGLDGLGRIEQDPACLNILDVDDDGHLLVRLLNYTAYDPAKIHLTETTMESLFRAFRLP